MASGTIKNNDIQYDVINLGSQTINTGDNSVYNLPTAYANKNVVAIIPISVGPSSWGSTVPAVFSGISVPNKQVFIRAYTTGTYNPFVVVGYY